MLATTWNAWIELRSIDGKAWCGGGLQDLVGDLPHAARRHMRMKRRLLGRAPGPRRRRSVEEGGPVGARSRGENRCEARRQAGPARPVELARKFGIAGEAEPIEEDRVELRLQALHADRPPSAVR